MATPRADTYTAASGAAVYAGMAAPAAVPSWVPATAWQWTDVPGSIWSSYIKDDGSGLAPLITLTDPGVDRTYLATWAYSGPVYSPSTHEFWHFGGGHAATTINLLTRWNLNSDSPSVTMPCAPSSESVRRTQALTNYSTYLANGPFFSDGKPYSPHSYYNNQYLPGLSGGTFLSFGLKFVASSSSGTDMGGGAQGFRAIAAFPRAGSAWSAANTYTDIPSGTDTEGGPRVVSADGASIYWWDTATGLRKWHGPTNTHSSIGGTAGRPYDPGPCCNNGADVSLHINRDSGSGWGVKTCNLTTGVQTTVTVSGYALPTGYQCHGVAYAASTSRYYAVWVDSTAYNNLGGTVAGVLVTELQLTGANTATAALKAMTGTAPTKCGSYTGVGFDDLFGCLMVCMDSRTPVKAIKVA